jgi:hypothetical protein
MRDDRGEGAGAVIVLTVGLLPVLLLAAATGEPPPWVFIPLGIVAALALAWLVANRRR